MRLAKFLFARLLNAAAILLLVALLTFLLVGQAPGDYLNELASDPQISASTLAHLREQYGLDSPFHIKFLAWLQTACSGDFGYSFVYQRPIAELIGERVWNTVLLNGVALLAAWVMGVALGVLAAVRHGKAADWLVGAAATLLVSTPAVVVSLLLLMLAVRLGLPVGGMTGADWESLSPAARLADLARHLLLPAAAVTAALLPAVARHTRTAMAEALQADCIRTARAKGLGRGRILIHHALRNAVNPLTTLFGYSVSALLSASLVVEVVMSWPGIGQLTYDAVLRRDLFLVVDLAVLSALLLLVGNIIGDVLLYVSDPRVAP
jgi:peptide/nickel transport system permease protein